MKNIKIKNTTFEKLNPNTKKAIGYMLNYSAANYGTLQDVYGSYSAAKEVAEDRIFEKMEELNGEGYKICSKNCNFFTAAFTAIVDKIPYLFYFTHANNYAIPLN